MISGKDTRAHLVLAVALAAVLPVSAAAQENNVAKLRELEEKFTNRAKADKAKISAWSKARGIQERIENEAGEAIEFVGFRNGFPATVATTNVEAFDTISVDEVWPGGSTGYGLTGSGVLLGIWDGGRADGSHSEFLSGTTSRIVAGDSSGLHSHATSAAGTLIATGITANARGAAYQSSLRSYDWNNDFAEMAKAATLGVAVSNHSYVWQAGWVNNLLGDGKWVWKGDPSVNSLTDYKFGFYDDNAADYDMVAYNAPRYLQVFSAGNNRLVGPTSQPVSHWVYDGWSGQYVLSSAIRNLSGGSTGYDTLPAGAQTAKNPLIVGACKNITGGYTNPSDVVMLANSSAGPTDDGRIKPDLVAPGEGTYTTGPSNGYTTVSGTSIAAPSAAGAAGLLVQQYRQKFGGVTPLSSTLKALLIHSADQAGTNVGPSYRYGWGLLNAKRAAQTIAQDPASYGSVSEHSIADGQIYTRTIVSDGVTPLKVTIAWVDPDTVPLVPALNPTTKVLVNDLDLRLIQGNTTYFPWVLNPTYPDMPATVGDNDRDNVEQVYIAAPPAGTYTVRVSSKTAQLAINGTQAFSLVVTGVQDPSPKVTSLALSSTTVAGGSSETVTGTIQLSGTAPSPGVTVNLSSSNTNATVPTTVTVPAGSKTASFVVNHIRLTGSNQTATITATANSSTATSTLTLAPWSLNSEFVSQTVPAQMRPGQVYAVSVTMKNTSNLPWTAANGFKLMPINALDNRTWTTDRALLASGESIPVNGTKTFTFNVTAPATIGQYNFQWQMTLEGESIFGATSSNLVVDVVAFDNDATGVSRTFPTVVTAGKVYSVSLTMRNIGGSTWTSGGGYKLAAPGGVADQVWGAGKVSVLSSEVIAPFMTKKFSFSITAPTTVGQHFSQWQMMQEGVGAFGGPTQKVAVTVVQNDYDAELVSQSVPATMTAGQTYSVSLTMKNTGSENWTPARGVVLCPINSYDNRTWAGRQSLDINQTVSYGQQKTFTFNVTAPTAPGIYNFQWQMLRSTSTLFGLPTTNVVVTVTP